MTTKKSKKKLWIIIGIALLIIVIIILAVFKGQKNEGTKVSVEKVTKRTIIQTVSALQKYNASQEKVNAQEEAFKYAQQKFDVGVMTSFDYNNSKKELTLAESQLLQAKYDFIFKTTILEFYMGNPIKIDRE